MVERSEIISIAPRYAPTCDEHARADGDDPRALAVPAMAPAAARDYVVAFSDERDECDGVGQHRLFWA
jgi:hypothetical protein